MSQVNWEESVRAQFLAIMRRDDCEYLCSMEYGRNEKKQKKR